jgi:histidinol-phosphate/aromatic aminotransferase/cobyric acid decarboxylase-like protein
VVIDEAYIDFSEKPSWLVELRISKFNYYPTLKSLWFSRNSLGFVMLQ